MKAFSTMYVKIKQKQFLKAGDDQDPGLAVPAQHLLLHAELNSGAGGDPHHSLCQCCTLLAVITLGLMEI